MIKSRRVVKYCIIIDALRPNAACGSCCIATWGLECCLRAPSIWSVVARLAERLRLDCHQPFGPTLFPQTTVWPVALSKCAPAPQAWPGSYKIILDCSFLENQLVSSQHAFVSPLSTETFIVAPSASHNFIGPQNKTRAAVTWTMLLCL